MFLKKLNKLGFIITFLAYLSCQMILPQQQEAMRIVLLIISALLVLLKAFAKGMKDSWLELLSFVLFFLSISVLENTLMISVYLLFISFAKDLDRKKIAYMMIIIIPLFILSHFFIAEIYGMEMGSSTFKSGRFFLLFESPHKMAKIMSLFFLSLYSQIDDNKKWIKVATCFIATVSVYLLPRVSTYYLLLPFVPLMEYVMSKIMDKKIRKVIDFTPLILLTLCVILMFAIPLKGRTEITTPIMRFNYPLRLLGFEEFSVIGYVKNVNILMHEAINDAFDNGYLRTLFEYGMFSTAIFFVLVDALTKENKAKYYAISLFWFITSIMLNTTYDFVLNWPLLCKKEDDKNEEKMD